MVRSLIVLLAALAPSLGGCDAGRELAGVVGRSEDVLRDKPKQTDSSLQGVEREIVRLTNLERQKHGLRPLTQDTRVDQVAYMHSLRMVEVGQLSHELDGLGPDERVTRARIGWREVAENLHSAAASRGGKPVFDDARYPEQAVRSWMQSPGHRANILLKDVTHIGVGVVRFEKGGRGHYYATQVFLRPLW
jgi:uncharacterized protein YkwD